MSIVQICLMVMKLLDLETLDATPSDSFPEMWADDEKVQYLTELAAKVVAVVWRATPLEDIREVCSSDAAPNSESVDEEDKWELCKDACQHGNSHFI